MTIEEQAISGQWPGNERRGIDGVTLQLMTEVRLMMEKHEAYEMEKFSAIQEEIRENRVESDERHSIVLSRLESMSSSTLSVIEKQNQSLREIHKLFMDAFPEGNATAHKQAHEDWIAKEEEDHKFWLGVKEKAVTAVVVAIIGWAGIALWAAFIHGPK